MGNPWVFHFQATKYFTALTLIAMVIGYLIGNLTIPRFISQSKALMDLCRGTRVYHHHRGHIHPCRTFGPYSIRRSGGATGASPLTVPLTVVLIALLGLANALVWPAIWPLAIHGLGKHTRIGQCMLIMAIVGWCHAAQIVWSMLAESSDRLSTGVLDHGAVLPLHSVVCAERCTDSALVDFPVYPGGVLKTAPPWEPLPTMPLPSTPG
jgi:fucose permease